MAIQTKEAARCRAKMKRTIMPVQLNHTIVWCRDKKRSSAFLVEILGCSPAIPFYHFMVVQLLGRSLEISA